MKIGLFFGSYNPVHVGHMIIANHMVNETNLDKIWMVVSPHNPHKKKSSLANDYDRLHLLRLAIGDNPKIQASDIEFSLSKPSYTIDTLTYLKEKYPTYHFSLIMGGDNIVSFHKWKNYEKILEAHDIYVYLRPNYKIEDSPVVHHPSVHLVEAPLLDISASMIRKLIKEGKSYEYLTTAAVYDYLENTQIYHQLLKA